MRKNCMTAATATVPAQWLPAWQCWKTWVPLATRLWIEVNKGMKCCNRGCCSTRRMTMLEMGNRIHWHRIGLEGRHAGAGRFPVQFTTRPADTIGGLQEKLLNH